MNIKKTLVSEARHLSAVARHDMPQLTGFAYKYFRKDKGDELIEAMKQSPASAENWLNKNY